MLSHLGNIKDCMVLPLPCLTCPFYNNVVRSLDHLASISKFLASMQKGTDKGGSPTSTDPTVKQPNTMAVRSTREPSDTPQASCNEVASMCTLCALTDLGESLLSERGAWASTVVYRCNRRL